jgi:hypothetical protein
VGDLEECRHRTRATPIRAGLVTVPALPGRGDPACGFFTADLLDGTRDPHPAPAPARLLHPADPHHPPDVAAKTHQKHDYPSAAHRRSYARRTSAERAFSTIKDPATNTISRGWCRLMGLAPLTLWLAALHTIRNQRILTAWETRQAQNNRRAAGGLPPRTRKRRRKTTLTTLTASP